MHPRGFSGYLGAGKTALVGRVIRLLRTTGLRVSVVKQAREGFDIDTPGKATFRDADLRKIEVWRAAAGKGVVDWLLSQSAHVEHKPELSL